MSRLRHPLVLLALAASSAALGAAETHTQLLISAVVPAQARLEQFSAPRSVTVSDADLMRGYLDVTDPVRVQVTSNSRAGYQLQLDTLLPLCRGIAIRGLGPDVLLPAEGGTVVQRWQHPQSLSLVLNFRLLLASDVRPGRYDWPLRLTVLPLAP